MEMEYFATPRTPLLKKESDLKLKNVLTTKEFILHHENLPI